MSGNIKDLPGNFPNGYHEVKVGDIVIMFADVHRILSEDHVHIYEVVNKGTRYADITMVLKKCMYEDKEYVVCQQHLIKEWDWFVNYAPYCRWLRTKAEKVLFGVT